MSNDGDIFTISTPENHERPLFFPWNRRLRHLQGISVRNLNVAAAPIHGRGRATADEDVEYTLKSPTKLLAQSEARSLHQTRSFTDLKSSTKGGNSSIQNRSSSQHEKDVQANSRPRFGGVRSRSNLRWLGAGARTKQRRPDVMGRERMAEAWFSLQIAGASEPTYISEVVDKSINPNFQFFDLNMNGPEVARSDGIQLKLWARTDRLNKFVLLIDLQICLRSLQFIGKSIDNFRQPLPLNCIVFHFEDGIYTSFTDMPVAEQSLASLSKSFAKAGVTRPDTTSTYNALMQLANVDECIRDALWMRAELERQINDHLSYSRQALEVLDRCRQAQEAVNANYRAISSEHRQIQLLRRKRDNILASIKLRRDVVECGRTTENRNQAAIHGLHKAIREVKTQSVHTTDDSNGQIRRICEDLALIYSLEPIKNRPLHFRIRNLYLPNSVFDDTNRDDIAAALGFTSKLTYMLSLYLSTPLPYPISPQSSHSTIQDPISVAIKERTFPLYPTNVSYKFEYGVFLLNKDIEFLMSKNGLRILDIRHTLPNLKYLLYVLTAGTGELPIRKAGGVRGLLAGQATPITSRRESEDSLNSSAGFDARQSEGQLQRDSQPPQVNGNEKAKAKAKAEAEAEISGRLLPPPSGKAYAYRNSSPREAI